MDLFYFFIYFITKHLKKHCDPTIHIHRQLKKKSLLTKRSHEEQNLVLGLSILAGLVSCEAVLAVNITKNASAGVGLVLYVKDGRYYIKDCPASRNKAIMVGDEIVKLKANGASNWVSIMGLPAKEVEDLMRGEVNKPHKFNVEILLKEDNC